MFKLIKASCASSYSLKYSGLSIILLRYFYSLVLHEKKLKISSYSYLRQLLFSYQRVKLQTIFFLIMFKFKKKDCVIGSIFIYVFLILLLIMLQDRHSVTTPCSYYKPCVRFCCFDKEFCNEKFIRENFNSSVLSLDLTEEHLNDTLDYKVLYGSPRCKLKEVPASDFNKSWSFIYVRTLKT